MRKPYELGKLAIMQKWLDFQPELALVGRALKLGLLFALIAAWLILVYAEPMYMEVVE